MKKTFIKTLIFMVVVSCLISSIGCAVDNYKEYPFIVKSLGDEFEYNGIKYIRLHNNPYWNNNEDKQNFGCLWNIKKEEFNEIVGKYYSSTLRPITSPMYKHDILGWDCLWGHGRVYLNENYILPKEKDLIISWIYAENINGQNFLKGKDVYEINEKVKEDIFANVKMKDIINETSFFDRGVPVLGREERYCNLQVDIFFDSNYFYLDTYFYINQDRVFVRLNDYIYEVKPEYVTQIYNYVREK